MWLGKCGWVCGWVCLVEGPVGVSAKDDSDNNKMAFKVSFGKH